MTVKFRNDSQARDAMERAQRDLDNATTRARETLVRYRKATNKALNDQMVPVPGRAQRVGELRKEASQRLLDIESEAQASVKAAAEAAAYLSRDQRTLGEQSRDRDLMRLAWERAQMMLAAGVPATEVLARAQEQGDTFTIEALDYFGRTFLEADIRGRGGSVNDIGQQLDALNRSLEGAREKHPAEVLLGDLSDGADDVALIATRARQEVQGGEPVVALHVEGGDFSETAPLARENATLLGRMGGAA